MSKYTLLQKEYAALRSALESCLQSKHGSILITGFTGCGKSMIVTEVLDHLNPRHIYIDALIYTRPADFFLDLWCRMTGKKHDTAEDIIRQFSNWLNVYSTPLVLVVDGIERIVAQSKFCRYFLTWSSQNLILIGMSNAMHDNIAPHFVAPRFKANVQHHIRFSGYDEKDLTEIATLYCPQRADELASACQSAAELVRVARRLAKSPNQSPLHMILPHIPRPKVDIRRLTALPLLQRRTLDIFARLYHANINVTFYTILDNLTMQLDLKPVDAVFQLSQLEAAGYVARRVDKTTPLIRDFFHLNVDFNVVMSALSQKKTEGIRRPIR